jgi:hypothetical protein
MLAVALAPSPVDVATLGSPKRPTSSRAPRGPMANLQADVRRALFRVVDFEMHDALERVHGDLMKRPKAKEFRTPVALPGYRDVIKQPMDLGTVHGFLMRDKRLAYPEKTYMVAEEFAHDMRLVFKNCFLFNQHVTHHVFKDGLHLAKNFERTYADELDKLEAKKKVRATSNAPPPRPPRPLRPPRRSDASPPIRRFAADASPCRVACASTIVSCACRCARAASCCSRTYGATRTRSGFGATIGARSATTT